MLIKNLHRFSRYSFKDKSLLIEATVLLTIAKTAVTFLPFRWIAPHLGQSMAETPLSDHSGHNRIEDRISWAIQTMSRYLPWECKCLVQAVCGKLMLRRRRLISTLYLGVAKDENGSLSAHAWLRCGHRILTGDSGAEQFKIISSFGDQGFSK